MDQVRSKHTRALGAEHAGWMHMKCFLEPFEQKADYCCTSQLSSSYSAGLSHLSPSLCFVVVCLLSFAMLPSLGTQATDVPLSFLLSSTTVL